jgi:hypothetical protein
MNRLKHFKYLLPTVIFIVFIANSLQGYLTELLPDEAYYWVYSQHMDWGFFDHPPMVAVWISISEFFFSDEIGVRFFSAISFSLLVYLVWKTIDHPRKQEFTWLFVLIMFSTALLNVYGFITTPDTPLMLFCALFLFAYKQYLKHKSLLSYVLLSVSIAGMMYSKYQGLLIVFFVFLSNIKLIKDYKLWLMALGALLLFLPHLYWQYENDFPSIRYHLYERVSNRKYKFEHTLMHFVNMIAIVGLTFPIMYTAFFKNIKTKDVFQRGLNFIIFGFLIFFFFSSFRGRVQAQWIVPISIPLILITFHYLMTRTKSRVWFVRLAFASIAIMLFARVLMFSEGLLPVKLNTHGNERWALELQSKTQGQEKIFVNSYQNVATYWYYTQEKAYYLKNFTGRKNHFTLMQQNQDLSTEKAALVSRIRLDHTDFGTHIRGKDSIFTSVVNGYIDYSQLKMNMLSESIEFKKGSVNEIPVEIENPFDRSIDLNNLQVYFGFLKKKKMEIIELEATLKTERSMINSNEIIQGSILIESHDFPDPDAYPMMGIGIKYKEKVDMIRVSNFRNYQVIN